MNQKLSDWANVAEILSGIAVVVTLIVLVAGIRDNTKVLRASEYSALIRELNTLQTVQMTDPVSAGLWRMFRAGEAYAEDMDPDDEFRLSLAVLSFSRVYETAYFSDKAGLLGNSERDRFTRVACVNYGRMREYGQIGVLETSLTEEYLEYLAETCPE